MKSLVKCVLIVLCITMFSSVQLYGQEWSAEQKEVWKTVETMWDLIAKHDLEGIMSYFHDDYSGWWPENALPANKAFLRKLFAHEFETTKILIQETQPVAIQIHGDMAIVQYYYFDLKKDADGKEKEWRGRWTEIYVKEGDKWVMIGDHGGSTE